MKRTEKIEVRVSLEEKQTLTQLAKQDGESVSGLIRGLVEKYMALNTASTTRKLPKWQIAAGLIVAAFVGHGLTLIPIHLHDRVHQSVEVTPTYMVHGAIDDAAFGVDVNAHSATKNLILNQGSEEAIRITLNFNSAADEGGKLLISICELSGTEICEDAFETRMDVSRTTPSVLGGYKTKSGKPIHIFVQEIA